MRHNGPVTQKEYVLRDDDVLISKTDTRSHIIYANQRFIDVSGYAYEELNGSPHNIVRHPDMPESVFADMWQDLQAGKFWSGLVKNRRKNGDHYWVRANVVPIRENGKLKGFASIRVKPSAEETAHAEAVYRDIREERGRYTVNHGRPYRRGALHSFKRFEWRSLKTRSFFASLAIAALPTALGVSAWSALDASSSLLDEGLLIAGVGGGFLMGWINWRANARLHRSLHQAHDFSLQLAAGNLRASLPAHGKDELGRMLGAMAFMRQSLAALIGDLERRIGVVEPSVTDLVHNNHAMASRLEQQASAVQQTAASAEQITVTVGQSAENASQAGKATLGNVEAVDHAAQVMQALAQSMQEITRQADNMAGIVDTIDSIAFQTNILALNASVEAARAGEHGRGFAVVAQEVRKLASESAGAAHRVQSLIGTARKEIEAGRSRAGEAETAMARIKLASHRVNGLMQEISAAAAEQSQGIEQISQAIGEIDRATQSSAGSMQRYQAATTSLDQEVQALAHSARAFSDSDTRPAASSAARPATPAVSHGSERLIREAVRGKQATQEWEAF
ncbi:methyl-accepting chemotaxis protein [Billgrantia kenyensis]|uniref:PAS domain-containing protein n=1 Tax=Billgrantia kenyensis TaxID=321266 RepID=A0A7W0ADC9_9GAMM|nr:PAS domain-containing methyl-accepting chemotaxis protein [Halomonas kenyensis]MBA2778390.1 PAS domain-containing protein [Halomonas kenyensis]MCG6660696.1 PAS domain-containing protein [Halomonas kenyensis]